MSSEKQDPKCPTNNMKLKILALHGYRQNAESFKIKTGSFRKMVHKWAQFTYITAPHRVISIHDPNDLGKSGPDIGQSKDEGKFYECSNKTILTFVEQYGWFFNRDDLTYRGIRKGGPAIGFGESLKLVEDIFEEEGPFDGILGFSQGACFTGLLCDLQQRGLIKFNFKFAILSSGFKSGSLPHLKYYIERIELPSLHIFGENDEVIPTEMSEALSNCFEDPLIVKHPGGHFLPASAPQKPEYQKFIRLMLEKQQMEQQKEEI